MPYGQENDEDIALRVYEYVLAHHSVTVPEIAADIGMPGTAVAWIMRNLRKLRLVRYCAEQETFTAVDPDSARVELVLPLEAAIYEKRRELALVHRQLGRFANAYKRHLRAQQRGELVVTLENPRELWLRLADSIRRGYGEILTMWPVNGCRTGLLDDTRSLTLEAVQRGVRVRALYPHTARSHPSFRANLQKNRETGAEVRTSDEVSRFLVIVDREAAFLPAASGDGASSVVTAMYEPVIVELLRGTYENIWQSACSFDGATTPESALDNVKGSILKMLASGLKDEVIARRVGTSSRTLRRYISAIMEELDAESRFQAGVAAANAGLVSGTAGLR
ncbi:hypothetical protein SMD11_0395 [Streptomyces albireticuli]|uniref:HTH luxR-type domain-containing protein n=1 Tax=Streptomyces albireticuli TaxID=1940 RepID=A0A1Z2KVT4_9ACTN|nr:hypothetical protein SMD11_0395 [Streptomyces albireticuli]